MPMLVANVAELNRRFHPENLADFAKSAAAFAPGKALDAGLLAKPGTVEHRAFQGYLNKLPAALQETLRGVIHHALTASPPRPVIFSWAPSYDYEITVWDAPCNITVLLKSRYPGDKEPVREDAAV